MSRVLNIARLGEPILFQKTPLIKDPTAPEIQEAVADMLHTMEVKGPFAGVAAPQLFLSLRICIFGLQKSDADSPRYSREFCPEGVPETIMINPVVTPLGDRTFTDWEACLSVPGLMGEVERPHAIHYTWQSLDGKTHEREAQGFHARVVQHEVDHLDGIVYTQRMKDLKSLRFMEEEMKYRQKEETQQAS